MLHRTLVCAAGSVMVGAVAAPAAAQQSTTWTGAVSTSWQSPGNWTNGVPAGDMEALILRPGFSGGVFLGAAADHTGRTVLERELILNGQGRIPNSVVQLADSGLLTLQPASLANPVIGNVLELRGGAVRVGTPAGVNVLRLVAHHSTFESLFHPLTAATLERAPGATLALNPGNADRSDIGRIRVTAPVQLPGSGAAPDRLPVAPWMTARNSVEPAFVTLDRSGSDPGFRPLNPATEYAPSLVAGANVRLTNDVTASQGVGLNTLTVAGGALNIAAGATVSLEGGGLLFAPTGAKPGSISGGGILALPAVEGIVHAFNGTAAGAPTASYSIDVPVTGGMLTKAGNGTLVLARSNSYAGGTNVNEGLVEAGAPGALGSGPVRLAGGGLRIGYADGTLANDLVLDSRKLPAGIFLPAGTTTLAGQISGSGNVGIGGGTLRIAGGGAAQGAYRFDRGDGGAILVDSNLASPAGILSLSGGSSLFGDGSVRGKVQTEQANLSPGAAGHGTGRLAIGFGDFYDSSLGIDLAGAAPGTQYDQLVALDGFRLSGSETNLLDVNIADGFLPAPGQSFTILDNRSAGLVDGIFTNLGGGEGAIFRAGNTSFRITYAGGDGNDVVLTVVPEPSALAVLSVGGMLLLRRRARRSGPLQRAARAPHVSTKTTRV